MSLQFRVLVTVCISPPTELSGQSLYDVWGYPIDGGWLGDNRKSMTVSSVLLYLFFRCRKRVL